jgi:hypothetical protein
MNDVNAVPITKIGVYEIHGDIKKIGYLTSAKISTQLYYNLSMRQFFWVKWFASGKCHIDFFDTNEAGLDYLDNPYGRGEVSVAFCSRQDCVRELFYNYETNSYSVSSYDGVSVYLAKMKGC